MDSKTMTAAEAAKELGIDAETAEENGLTGETVGELSNGKGEDEDE